MVMNRDSHCLECGRSFHTRCAEIFCSVQCGLAWRKRTSMPGATIRSRRPGHVAPTTRRTSRNPSQEQAASYPSDRQAPPGLALTLRLEVDYTDSALPYLQSFGAAHRPQLHDAVSTLPGDWSFEDRVFVTLAPRYRHQVARYYSGNGRRLADVHSPSALARLDVELVRRCHDLLDSIHAARARS